MSVYSRLLLAAVVVSGALLQAGSASAQTTTEQKPMITVTGEAEVHVEPDIATVSVGVMSIAPTADQAMTQVSQRQAAVIAGIRALGVASRDIQTSGLSLQPIYRQRPQSDETPPQIQGYRASNNVSIVVRDLASASAVLDSAINNGANNVGGISFGLSDPDAAKRQALAQATASAHAKAQAIATSAGIALGPIISITEDSTSLPSPRAMSYAGYASAPGAAPAPPVESGEMIVRATVRVSYAI